MNKTLDAAKKSLMDCYDALAGDYGTSEGARKRVRKGTGAHPNPEVHEFATSRGYTYGGYTSKPSSSYGGYTSKAGRSHIYNHPTVGQMNLPSSAKVHHAEHHHHANIVKYRETLK